MEPDVLCYVPALIGPVRLTGAASFIANAGRGNRRTLSGNGLDQQQ
jgi:hypothetical protein